MKRPLLVVGLIFLLSAVLAAGVVFAQQKILKPSPTCSYEEQKDKDGNVVYALTGKDCKAAAEKINKNAANDQTKVYGCKCQCTLETGSDIWICRCCTRKQLDW